MSGGGGYGGDGSSGTAGPDCTKLRIKTSLSSPVPTIVSKLVPGDLLRLRLQKEGGPLLAVAPGGKTAGSIAGGQLLALLRCIEEGNVYEAEVMKITGGNVEVEIRYKET